MDGRKGGWRGGERGKGIKGGGSLSSGHKWYTGGSLNLFIYSLFSYFFKGKSPSFHLSLAHLESTLSKAPKQSENHLQKAVCYRLSQRIL